ncbi:MAG: lysine--tRNA ligase [Planctomycetota bacterium]
MPEKPDAEQTTDLHHLEQQRLANAEALRGLGVEPYGDRVDDVLLPSEARERYDEKADLEQQANAAKVKEANKAGTEPPVFEDLRPRVRVGGRVVLHRDNGKLVWLNLRIQGEQIQVAVSKRDASETGFAIAKKLDLGDIVAAEGPLMKTKTGEITVWASDVFCGAKCLVPPPEKHAGLADVEARYRQRYIDLWANPETTASFALRSAIVGNIRKEMDDRGYLEVETPMLQSQAGGAAARPFITKMNALDIDLYLRIAPELYLKRLLVGGLPKVYEINRNFRNEGLDKQHNPEFTMLEAYVAFGDVETVMNLTEDLTRSSAVLAAKHREGLTDEQRGSLHLPFGEIEIDYQNPFDRVAYFGLFEKVFGFDAADTGRVMDEAAKRHVKTKNEEGVELDPIFVTNELFEDFAETTLDPAKPTFITHYPAALSPLTRPNREKATIADRSDLFIGGMEISPNYTELNDPEVQAAKFREQLAGLDDEESTFRNFDTDFVEALRVGMPPAGGMGLGIDRLVMLMTGQQTIRDVVLFPQMRAVEKPS